MEEFFLKLGLMTQRNHAELIQEIRALRTSMDALTAEISKLADTSTSNHAELKDCVGNVAEKISALADTSASNHTELKDCVGNVAEKISTLADTSALNHNELKYCVGDVNEKVSEFADTSVANQIELKKYVSFLTKKITADDSADKESLKSIEELLRLTAANQMMNLIAK